VQRGGVGVQIPKGLEELEPREAGARQLSPAGQSPSTPQPHNPGPPTSTPQSGPWEPKVVAHCWSLLQAAQRPVVESQTARPTKAGHEGKACDVQGRPQKLVAGPPFARAVPGKQARPPSPHCASLSQPQTPTAPPSRPSQIGQKPPHWALPVQAPFSQIPAGQALQVPSTQKG
jgi:hypothetical protein